MHSEELYRQLLGLTTPWDVERVALNMTEQRVDVYVGHPARQQFACPTCGWVLSLWWIGPLPRCCDPHKCRMNQRKFDIGAAVA